MSEEKKEKKEIEKWTLEYSDGSHEIFAAGPKIIPGGQEIIVVRESEYKLLAGENKKLRYELQKMADEIGELNKAIDQFADEKQLVPVAVHDETKLRLEICRKKLKRLNAYQGE